MKVTIGFGAIWGLLVLGLVLFSGFTVGANDTAPEVFVLAADGLTILPACLLAMWFPSRSGLWLMQLAGLSALGFTYQVAVQTAPFRQEWISYLVILMGCFITGYVGYLLRRLASSERLQLASNMQA